MTPGWWERHRRRRHLARRDWREVDFVVIDFETTGLDASRARPLSVGWLVVQGGVVALRHGGYTTIRHDGDLTGPSVAVHGLLPEDLAGAPSAEEVGARLRPVLRGRIVVAHGAWLERAMLERCEVHVPRRELVDTIHLTRRVARPGPGGARYALSAVAATLGVPAQRAHHAFGDALTTAGVFLTLAARLERDRNGIPAGDLLRLGRD